jgi:hypothetical protein
MHDTVGILMGWMPEEGFHHLTWHGYNEAMIVYILALGSPSHPVPSSTWDHWTSSYLWAEHFGQTYVNFAPLFGHQYSHLFLDFRGIQDAYMREKGIDYFENSRRATYAQRAYVADNPGRWRAYSDTLWGLSACDGPRDTTLVMDGIRRRFHTYSARGTSVDWTHDDGTLTPTAPGGSLPFAPEICIPALKTMRAYGGKSLWTEFGFKDAFNPTYVSETTGPQGWVGPDYLGIDQGPIMMMIENLRTGFIWKTLRNNPYVRTGLLRAGFKGGWLEEKR